MLNQIVTHFQNACCITGTDDRYLVEQMHGWIRAAQDDKYAWQSFIYVYCLIGLLNICCKRTQFHKRILLSYNIIYCIIELLNNIFHDHLMQIYTQFCDK